MLNAKDIHRFRWRRLLLPQSLHRWPLVFVGVLITGFSGQVVTRIFCHTRCIGGHHQREGCGIWHVKQWQQHHMLKQTRCTSGHQVLSFISVRRILFKGVGIKFELFHTSPQVVLEPHALPSSRSPSYLKLTVHHLTRQAVQRHPLDVSSPA